MAIGGQERPSVEEFHDLYSSKCFTHEKWVFFANITPKIKLNILCTKYSNQLTKANFFAMQLILEYSMFDGINSAS